MGRWECEGDRGWDRQWVDISGKLKHFKTSNRIYPISGLLSLVQVEEYCF